MTRRRDPKAHCDRCEALCCRLTVVVFPEDPVPAHLTERNEEGTVLMARAADGRCMALDSTTSRCTIYDVRPTQCRRFTMAGPYCLAIREEAQRSAHALTITLL